MGTDGADPDRVNRNEPMRDEGRRASIGFGCTGNALPAAEAAAQPPAEARSGLIQ